LQSSGKLSSLQLKDEKFILLDQKSTIHRLCIDACRKSGFSPNVKFTISRHEPLLAMVELGLGITLFPRRLLMDEPGLRLAIVELEVPVVSGVAIIRRKDKKMSLGAERFFNTFPTA